MPASRAGCDSAAALLTLLHRCASLQLRGSKSVEAANDKFTATMTNVVRWQEAESGGSGKEICSDTSLQVLACCWEAAGEARRDCGLDTSLQVLACNWEAAGRQGSTLSGLSGL